MRPLLCIPLVLAAVAPAPGRAQAPVVPAQPGLEKLFDGGFFLEGPAASPDGTIYFSDITNPPASGWQLGHIWRFDPRSGATTIFRSPSGQSNGLEFDAEGRLVAVEGANAGGRRVTRTDLSTGRAVALALNFNGRAFNSPNDLTIDERGRVWFTDPRYSGPETLEQPVMGVYRIETDGTVRLMAGNAGKPNGIVVSPDQRTLYVASSDNGATGGVPPGVPLEPVHRAIFAYAIAEDGTLGPRRTLVAWSDGSSPDGIAVDVEGNVWAAMARPRASGVCAYAPDGRELGCIPVPEVPSNVAFGRGAERSTLYITARTGLYRVKVGREGYQLPVR